MIPQWQTGVVQQIVQLTNNTRHYRLLLPEVIDFSFMPGQFVTFDLPIHEQRNKRWRSYSIASMPDGSNIIELSIAFLPGGLASDYLLNEIKEGSSITLRGPQGVFVLPETIEKDIFLICTGTGVAPFRSMLQYIEGHSVPHRHIHLIFGSRTAEDVLYWEEMQRFETTINGFHYHLALSREIWHGYQGYVHPIYERLCTDRPNAMFMLCGQKVMIDEAKQRILQMGYTNKDIHIEIYG